jgi:hypothetical protein
MSERLIEATYRLRLSAVAAEVLAGSDAPAEERDLARRALDACAAIERSVAQDEAAVLETALGVTPAARLDHRDHDRQNHTLAVRVGSVDDALEIADALASDGFERWETWTDGALESFRRFGDRLTMARTDGSTLVVRVIWAGRATASGWRHTLRRLTTPTAGDWSLVGLPRWAWWGYSVVRPLRQVAERIGVRRRHDASLGPFLATPDSLLDPLFDFGDVGADDTVIDLGCGDGRIAVAAARRFGCVARGVEQSPELVARAHQRVEAAGVADLVDVRIGDARTADLDGVDVVFMFLPADVVSVLLPDVIGRLRPGARVVVHEQSRPLVPAELAPTISRLITAADAVTVAHRWDVS